MLNKQGIRQVNVLSDFNKEKTAWFYDGAAKKLGIKTAGGANTEICLTIFGRK